MSSALFKPYRIRNRSAISTGGLYADFHIKKNSHGFLCLHHASLAGGVMFSTIPFGNMWTRYFENELTDIEHGTNGPQGWARAWKINHGVRRWKVKVTRGRSSLWHRVTLTFDLLIQGWSFHLEAWRRRHFGSSRFSNLNPQANVHCYIRHVDQQCPLRWRVLTRSSWIRTLTSTTSVVGRWHCTTWAFLRSRQTYTCRPMYCSD